MFCGHPFAAFRKQGINLLQQLLGHKISPPPIFSSYRKSQRKVRSKQKDFQFVPTTPPPALSAHALWAEPLFQIWPFIKGTRVTTGLPATDKLTMSYQDKIFSSEDLHSNCLSMSRYSIYSNNLQSHHASVPI